MLNFGIVATALYVLAIKPVAKTLDERQQIADGLQYAEEMKTQLAEAERERAEKIKEAAETQHPQRGARAVQGNARAEDAEAAAPTGRSSARRAKRPNSSVKNAFRRPPRSGSPRRGHHLHRPFKELSAADKSPMPQPRSSPARSTRRPPAFNIRLRRTTRLTRDKKPQLREEAR